MLVKSLSFPSNLFPSFSASEIGTNQRWAPSKSSNSLSFSSKLQFLRKSTQNSSGVGPDDAVIIVDHGSRRQESNLMLNEFVEMFRHKTGYQIVEPAHMELAEPSIGDAFQSCVRQGAHRVIISPFFLGPGRHWSKDIPSLSAEAAKQHPGVSYIVAAPLGLHELLVMADNGYGSMSSYATKMYEGLPPLSTLEMLIPANAVGKVMGKGGANLANIMKISGATVEISESKSYRGERVALISGTSEEKRAAENLIQAFIMAT